MSDDFDQTAIFHPLTLGVAISLVVISVGLVLDALLTDDDVNDALQVLIRVLIVVIGAVVGFGTGWTIRRRRSGDEEEAKT